MGGVAVGLTTQTIGARLGAMVADVQARAGVRPDRFLVQQMVAGGTELILGLHKDALGTAVMLGMGALRPNCSRTPRCACCPTMGHSWVC